MSPTFARLEWTAGKIELPPHACDNCGGEGQEQVLDACEPEGVYSKTCSNCGGSGHMISWKKLCEDAHINAKNKGFLDKPRSFAGDITLMHSELSEALEEYRNHKGLNETYYEVKKENGGISLTEMVSTLKEGAHGKPCGIPTELADVIIRVCQYCGSNDVDLAGAMEVLAESSRVLEKQLPPYTSADFEEFIANSHTDFSQIYMDHLEGNTNAVRLGFAYVVKRIMNFCKDKNIDIETAIFKKQVYNESRPHRHGNKLI